MLADTAGIGNTAITGDKLTAMPQIEEVSDKTAFPFGQAHTGYTLSANLGFDHGSGHRRRAAEQPGAVAHRTGRTRRTGMARHLRGPRIRIRQRLPR